MRTTITLDDTIDRELKEIAGRGGVPYKVTLNRVLRAGLDALRRPTRPTPYRITPKSLGLLPGVDYDKVGQLADEMDDLSAIREDHAAP
ncbi:MAG: DUF2191 domain-containing protein [Lentisphaerae bacterium]|nr:DUF2191 domain-containing protein [Lentisphaerota bacterium]